MSEEQETAKVKKQGSGKAKKIIMAIVAIAVVAAVVVGVLVLTGKLDINMSKPSKMEAGVEKLVESYSSPFTALMDNAEKNNVEVKVLKNFDLKQATELKTDVSVKVDELSVEGLTSSEEKTVNSIVELINAIKLGAEVRYDGKDTAYVKLNSSIEDVNISGEAVYDGSLSVRSEEVNDQWMTISEEDMEELLDDSGMSSVDLEEILGEFETYIEKVAEAGEKINIDDKKLEKIEDRYKKVFTDFIKEKSKDIEEEKDKVTVDGKSKSCKKLTLELKEKDLKKLLKKYLETFKDDKDIKEILEAYFDAYGEAYGSLMESIDTYGYYEADDLKGMLDEIYDGIDDAIDEIDDVDLKGAKIKLEVYATTTNVYKTNISFEVSEGKVVLDTTFNEDTTVTEISAKSGAVSMDIATITITNKENNAGFKVELNKSLTQQLGIDKASFEMNWEVSDSKSKVTLAVDAGKEGKGSIEVESKVNKNEEKAYEGTTVIKVDVNVPDYCKVKGSTTVNTGLKVGDASIPSTSDSVDMTDEKAMEEYGKTAVENLEKLSEKIQDLKVYSTIEDLMSDLSVDLSELLPN